MEAWKFMGDDGGEEEDKEGQDLNISIPEPDPFVELNPVDTKKV